MSENRRQWITFGVAAAGVVSVVMLWKLTSKSKTLATAKLVPRGNKDDPGLLVPKGKDPIQGASSISTENARNSEEEKALAAAQAMEEVNRAALVEEEEEVIAAAKVELDEANDRAAKGKAEEEKQVRERQARDAAAAQAIEEANQAEETARQVAEEAATLAIRKVEAAKQEILRQHQHQLKLQDLQEEEKKGRMKVGNYFQHGTEQIQEVEEQERYVHHETAAMVAKQGEQRAKAIHIRESMERERQEVVAHAQEDARRQEASLKEVEQLRASSVPREQSPATFGSGFDAVSPSPASPKNNQQYKMKGVSVSAPQDVIQLQRTIVPETHFAEMRKQQQSNSPSDVKTSLNVVAPSKLSVELRSSSAMSVLGLEVPTNTAALLAKFGSDSDHSPFVFNASSGCVNPIAHYPLCQSRFTATKPGTDDSFTADFVLLAEDISLSHATQTKGQERKMQQQYSESSPSSPTSPLSPTEISRQHTAIYTSKSIDALFSLEQMDGKRLKLLHKERSSNLVDSPFDYYAGLTVEPRPDVGVTATMYVANLYKVVVPDGSSGDSGGPVAYTFQLMCPNACQEEAFDLFLTLAQSARIDPRVTLDSPLSGRVRFHHDTVVLELPLSYSIKVSTSAERQEPNQGARLESKRENSSLAPPLFKFRSAPSESYCTLLYSEESGDNLDANVVDTIIPGTDYVLRCVRDWSQYLDHVRILATTKAQDSIIRNPRSIVEGEAFYVSPLLCFPLPKFGFPFVVEHKFGDALLSMYTDLSVPQSDSDDGSSEEGQPTTTATYAELTVGLMFGEKGMVSDSFTTEVLQSNPTVGGFVHEEQTKRFPDLSSGADSGIIETEIIKVLGKSRVLGEDMTLCFFAIRTMPDEWLVLKFTFPTISSNNQWLSYMYGFPDRLRLV